MTWQKIQQENFRSWQHLADFLELTPDQQKQILKNPRFPLNLPRRLASKIEKGRLDDPLLLQFLALEKETEKKTGFVQDPVSDQSFQKSPRLLHKYPHRALLLCTSSCAMHCRFCFRKNYPYEKKIADFTPELEMLRNDPSIYEVILSGGDPLSLSDERLQLLIRELELIPHIKLLRFHTRFPTGIPERINRTFLAMIEKTRLQVVFVLHINHPLELDVDVAKALKSVQKIGASVLSQTVLLKGVNDSLPIMKDLMLKLVEAGVTPYYLHQLDRVLGTHHFETTIAEGHALIAQLRKTLPGYAVPTYVQEIPHEKSKTALHPAHRLETQDTQSLCHHAGCEFA